MNIFANNIPVFRKIWGILSFSEKRNALYLLGLMLMGMVLETLSVGMVVPAIALLAQNDFIERYPSFHPVLYFFGNPSHQSLIIGGLAALLVVYFIKNFFQAIFAWQQSAFTFNLQSRLSQELFGIYLRQPYAFHLQRNSAHLIRNVFSDVGVFTGLSVAPTMLLLAEGFVLLGLCCLLLLIEPVGVMIVIGVLGAIAWKFHRLTSRYVSRWGEERQLHDGLRIQHIQQGLGGVKDVKLLGREAEFLDQYRVHCVKNARISQRTTFLSQLPRLWLELFAISAFVLLAFSMMAQGRALSAVMPTLGLFAAAAFRLMPTVSRMLSALQSLRFGLPVIDSLHMDLNLTVPASAEEMQTPVPFLERMEVDSICYTYAGAQSPALKNLSVSINRGETVGFIGCSGAGKSTLVDIILGLLEPDSGVVRVDRVDIQAHLRAWQDQIGYVPQSIYLTDDTLRRNVAFGLSNDQIDDDAVWRALHCAQLDEYVRGLPQMLDTVVGERGIRLSGGQRQRIGIARALYHDPAVLVLDEATSSLDTDTERGVMEAILELHGVKTIVVVAHRLSTVAHCDRLYRLDRGELVGAGTPEEMLSSQDLVYLQNNARHGGEQDVQTDNRC